MMQVETRIEGPVAVIGDVHGQADELRRVIDKLSRVPDIHNRWIVFIGDLVDRGPNSKAVLDIFVELSDRHGKVTCLCGNHELAMAGSLGLISTPDFIDWPGRWLPAYDSDTTFASYGVPHGDLAGLREALPERHAQLLSDLPWRIEHPHLLFVHAGLDPAMSFDIQVQILRERDYSLAHPPWLFSKSFIKGPVPAGCPVTLVIGHVPIAEVYFGKQIIATDTTGGVQGDLSCVLLPEGIVLTSGDDEPREAMTERRPKKKPWWQVF